MFWFFWWGPRAPNLRKVDYERDPWPYHLAFSCIYAEESKFLAIAVIIGSAPPAFARLGG